MAGKKQEKVLTGYLIKGRWSSKLGQNSSITHKVGDVVGVDDVEIPEGRDRALYLEQLERIGVIVPQYETVAEPELVTGQAEPSYEATGSKALKSDRMMTLSVPPEPLQSPEKAETEAEATKTQEQP